LNIDRHIYRTAKTVNDSGGGGATTKEKLSPECEDPPCRNDDKKNEMFSRLKVLEKGSSYNLLPGSFYGQKEELGMANLSDSGKTSLISSSAPCPK